MDIKKFLCSTLLVGILAAAGCGKVADDSELKFGEEVGVTAQANTTTTNLSMTKPALGSSGWGTLLNANFDILDGKYNSTGTPLILADMATVGSGGDYATITAAIAATPLWIVVAPGNYSAEAAITIPDGTILVGYGANLPTVTSGTYYSFATTGTLTSGGGTAGLAFDGAVTITAAGNDITIEENVIVNDNLTVAGRTLGAQHIIEFSKTGATGNAYMVYGNVTAGTGEGIPMMRAGSITGFAVIYDCTADGGAGGAFHVEIQKNDVTVWSTTSTQMSATDQPTEVGTQARDTDSFAAGDIIVCKLLEDSGDATLNAYISIEVTFDD